VVEEECIIGALTFVPAKMHIPRRSVVVGNPAKIIKEVSDEMIDWKSEGTALYQQLPAHCHQHLKPVEPLTQVEANRPKQAKVYDIWKNRS
jgi:phenylacetic acid degradation protein